jgi:hypothetical protein
MPQRSLSPDEGRDTYAGSKDGRWLPSHGKCAAVPGWEQGLSFHTFSLPEDRCVRLLLKKLGKHMPDSVLRE